MERRLREAVAQVARNTKDFSNQFNRVVPKEAAEGLVVLWGSSGRGPIEPTTHDDTGVTIVTGRGIRGHEKVPACGHHEVPARGHLEVPTPR
jgi:hypothetical protein